MTNPFLIWAGGKTRLLPRLLKYWQGDCRYLEPFCGSAAFFFSVLPKTALLNDANRDVFNAFTCVQSNAAAVASCLEQWGCSKDEYYDVRNLDETSLTDCQKAARTIYLMRLCYGGIYRKNQHGKFNVPYGGGRKTGRLPSEQQLNDCSDALKHAVLSNEDFESFLNTNAKEGDFIYLDPPFPGTMHDFSSDSVKTDRLIEVINELDDRSCQFVLSYAAFDGYQDCFESKWTISEIPVMRTVSSKTANRKTAKEIIVSNIESAR